MSTRAYEHHRKPPIVFRHRRRTAMAAILIAAMLAVTTGIAPADARPNPRGDETTVAKRGQQLWHSAKLNGANGLYVGTNGLVYTASVFGNEIVVQDSDSGAILDRIGPERGVNGPDDVFVTDDGTIYWTDILGGTVGMLKPNGDFRTQFIAPGVNPITMSDDGRLFVSLVFLGEGLLELDPELIDPPISVFPNDISPVAGMNGMDFGPDGMLYGPLFFGAKVVRVDVSNLVPGVDPPVEVVAEGFNTPAAVKFNSLGELHVADLAEGQVIRVDIDTGTKDIVADIDGIIDNLAFDDQDRLFFAADGDGQTMRVEANGRLTRLSRTGWSGPGGIAVTDNGKVWVGDSAELRGFKPGQRERPSDTYYSRFDPTGFGGASTVSADGDVLVTLGALTGAVQVIDPKTGIAAESYFPGGALLNAVAHGDALVVSDLFTGLTDVRTGQPVGTGGFAYPLGLASDGTTLYVSDYALGTVTAIGPNGSEVIASGLVTPEGIAIDGDRLLIVEEALDRVVAVDIATGAITPLITGLDLAPTAPVSDFLLPHFNFNDVAVAPNGNVYVSQDGEKNAVYRFRSLPA